MDFKTFFSVFVAVFLAEIGDKTQLATMGFASDASVSKWIVFLGSALALVTAAGIGVLVGSQLERFASPKVLNIASGVLFIVIGVYSIFFKS
jgi:putative Ca2+/H+ antiporter (TMEM165/GDT1 family)